MIGFENLLPGLTSWNLSVTLAFWYPILLAVKKHDDEYLKCSLR